MRTCWSVAVFNLITTLIFWFSERRFQRRTHCARGPAQYTCPSPVNEASAYHENSDIGSIYSPKHLSAGKYAKRLIAWKRRVIKLFCKRTLLVYSQIWQQLRRWPWYRNAGRHDPAVRFVSIKGAGLCGQTRRSEDRAGRPAAGDLPQCGVAQIEQSPM